MPIRKLRDYLESHEVHYDSRMHPQTYTAQHTAQATHTKGRDMAKPVVMCSDEGTWMVVMPAHKQVDPNKVMAMTGAHHLMLAREQDLRGLFPDCELGAMPPFGNLYGLNVLMQQEMAQEPEIAFNAGTHTEVIRMAVKDFTELVHPTMGDFSE